MAPETAEVMETRRSEASTERYITLCATGKRPVPGVDPGHRPSLSRGTSNWKPSGKLPWELEKLTGNLHLRAAAPTAPVPDSLLGVDVVVLDALGERLPLGPGEGQDWVGRVLAVAYLDGAVLGITGLDAVASVGL